MRSALFGAVLAGATLVAAPAAYAAHPAVSFRSIEYNAGDRTAEAQNALGGAIPAGTPIAQAQAVLKDAGASCRPSRHEANTIRCLYNEMAATDENFDDIRYTTHLHTADGVVTDLTVERVVDTHSGN
ncbi:hypothetical protein [Sphingomonas sp. PR090111-T3T-6A]|uniref:hypothetical protein n=1 Tax=Sphingomonas sp. PR090111-T3T-6A TaxID=685778 RepID=UPI00036437EF|nr:hypothetical protein [Sphingomonas sp. PR090111-T3T-6A]